MEKEINYTLISKKLNDIAKELSAYGDQCNAEEERLGNLLIIRSLALKSLAMSFSLDACGVVLIQKNEHALAETCADYVCHITQQCDILVYEIDKDNFIEECLNFTEIMNVIK